MIRTVPEIAARQRQRKTISLAFRMNGTKKTRAQVCSEVSDSYVLFTAKTFRGNSDLCLAFQISIEIPPLFWRYRERSDRPASVSTGVCLTRGGLTLGVRARNAAHIALSSKRELQVSNIPLGFGLRSDFTPPISSLLSTRLLFISLCLSCFIISLSSLKIAPVTITDRRRGDLLPAAECLVAANTADGRDEDLWVGVSGRSDRAAGGSDSGDQTPWRGRTRTETKTIPVSRSPQGVHAKMGFLL